MSRVAKLVCAAALGAVCILSVESAFARGGGSNFMNSPGYQRRLQESRGQVAVQSASQPYTRPPGVYPGRTWRHRGRR